MSSEILRLQRDPSRTPKWFLFRAVDACHPFCWHGRMLLGAMPLTHPDDVFGSSWDRQIGHGLCLLASRCCTAYWTQVAKRCFCLAGSCLLTLRYACQSRPVEQALVVGFGRQSADSLLACFGEQGQLPPWIPQGEGVCQHVWRFRASPAEQVLYLPLPFLEVGNGCRHLAFQSVLYGWALVWSCCWVWLHAFSRYWG